MHGMVQRLSSLRCNLAMTAMTMSTLDNVPQTQGTKNRDSSLLGLAAVAVGILASLLWVAFLGWGLGWVVAQAIRWMWS
jgi:hypothetical protein